MTRAIVIPDGQATVEKVQYDINFHGRMASGDSVASATATHTPPSGSATTPTVGTISNDIVPVVFGTLSVLGTHYLDVIATTTNSQKYSVRLTIAVSF